MTTKAACFPCELAEFDFWCVKLCVCLCATKQHVCVCVCVCVCLSPFAKRALFGLCLTSYLPTSPRGALVSVWPCRAILPLVPAHQTPIGRPLHALHRSWPYRWGWERERHINQTKWFYFLFFFFFFLPELMYFLSVGRLWWHRRETLVAVVHF